MLTAVSIEDTCHRYTVCLCLSTPYSGRYLLLSPLSKIDTMSSEITTKSSIVPLLMRNTEGDAISISACMDEQVAHGSLKGGWMTTVRYLLLLNLLPLFSSHGTLLSPVLFAKCPRESAADLPRTSQRYYVGSIRNFCRRELPNLILIRSKRLNKIIRKANNKLPEKLEPQTVQVSRYLDSVCGRHFDFVSYSSAI